MEKEGIFSSQQLRSEGQWQASWLPIWVNIWVLTLCLLRWQTAFSDFLTGSSKDLAKHVKLIVSVQGCSGPGRGVSCGGARSSPLAHLSVSGLGRGCVPGVISFPCLGEQSPQGAEREAVSS